MRIFIAKKEDDRIQAQRIRQILAPLLGDSHKIVMSQDIPKGEPWKPWILSQLGEADMLLVLFSGQSRNWEWCNYEMGLFTPLSQRPPKPIICIHPPDQKTPNTVDDLQSLPCTVDDIKAFLKRLFEGEYTEGTPINSAAAQDDEQLTELANRVHDTLAYHGETDTRMYYTRHITVRLTPDQDGTVHLDDEAIIDGDPFSLEIFGIVKRQPPAAWKWKEFRKYLAECAEEAGSDGQAVIAKFSEMVDKVCRDEVIAPLDELIKSKASKICYRLVVHRRDCYYDGTYRIRWLFIQVPGELDTGPVMARPVSPG